ncbi:uncharacterized protein ASPGLDRAFT_1503141 [Aspergillus glaucus CBS 516.65]|uniref:Uncharacterized protein n=1 Tax=Aspergillus glaucus CBS 516.65 TaxID=1160497 RepID=A0A1L9V832_ASPGL|nr:hypothetical protein ASPGLDRAFT_1503141 [Aspergillus glaucus CBS 516.65]OJJ80019.1 hypothetical protein ASPGLDRAFT_1503141 [Aspergillus glaucus CBS 516.65]
MTRRVSPGSKVSDQLTLESNAHVCIARKRRRYKARGSRLEAQEFLAVQSRPVCSGMTSGEAFDESAVPQKASFYQSRAFWPAQAPWELGLPPGRIWTGIRAIRCLCTPPRTWSECLLKVSRKEDSESRSRSSPAVVRRIGGETTAGLVGFHLGSRNTGVMQFKLNQLDETSLGACKTRSISEECDEDLRGTKARRIP